MVCLVCKSVFKGLLCFKVENRVMAKFELEYIFIEGTVDDNLLKL